MTSERKVEAEASLAFVEQARRFLKDEYLPKIERCLEKLSDEQIWWRANPESNSIGNLILHLSGNARQWIVCGLGGDTDARVRQAEFNERKIIPRDELFLRLRKTLVDVDKVMASFDSSLLLHKYQIQGAEVTALEAVFHVTEHFSMHTGQIILLTKMLSGIDLVFYDFSTGKPIHTWHQRR